MESNELEGENAVGFFMPRWKSVDIDTIECLIRRMRVEFGKTRPENLMTGHTGYLTFARKAYEHTV